MSGSLYQGPFKGSRSLEGSRSAIVGGTSGMGLAAAAGLQELGSKVHVIGRDPERMAEAVAYLGSDAGGTAVDALDENSLAEVFRSIAPIDHLVVSVGGRGAGPLFTAAPLEHWRGMADGKFWASITCLHAAVPFLAPAASVTLVTGVASRRPMKGSAVLTAVNAALEALVGGLALEMAPIRVNAVSPGRTETPYWSTVPEARRAEIFRETAAKVPLGRAGLPEDAATAVLFCAVSSYVTGSVIDCDGGMKLA